MRYIFGWNEVERPHVMESNSGVQVISAKDDATALKKAKKLCGDSAKITFLYAIRHRIRIRQ